MSASDDSESGADIFTLEYSAKPSASAFSDIIDGSGIILKLPLELDACKPAAPKYNNEETRSIPESLFMATKR